MASSRSLGARGSRAQPAGCRKGGPARRAARAPGAAPRRASRRAGVARTASASAPGEARHQSRVGAERDDLAGRQRPVVLGNGEVLVDHAPALEGDVADDASLLERPSRARTRPCGRRSRARGGGASPARGRSARRRPTSTRHAAGARRCPGSRREAAGRTGARPARPRRRRRSARGSSRTTAPSGPPRCSSSAEIGASSTRDDLREPGPDPGVPVLVGRLDLDRRRRPAARASSIRRRTTSSVGAPSTLRFVRHQP